MHPLILLQVPKDLAFTIFKRNNFQVNVQRIAILLFIFNVNRTTVALLIGVPFCQLISLAYI